MSAYATSRLGFAAQRTLIGHDARGSVLDALLDQIADRVAARLAGPLAHESSEPEDDRWFDSRHAAEYLGMHRDTLRKLAAERTIPSEQDGPNCKLYFRRSDLDDWQRTGGRPRHLATTLRRAA